MPLSRATVLRAALALVDREGADALTMRRLAGELGVSAMALYKHVADRQDLLDGVADLVAREMEPDGAGLRPLLRAVRRALLAHPNAVPLVQSTRATTPALMAPYERAMALLDGDRAVWAALIALTTGHVAYQLNGHLPGFDWDAGFEQALDRMLGGSA